MVLKQMLNDLKLFKNEIELKVVEDYIALLIQDKDDINEDECQKDGTLGECLEWITNIVNNSPKGSVSKQIALLKLLYLLQIKKLNTLSDNMHSNDLRFSLINNGCNLLSLCFSHGYFSNIEYFICESLCQIKKLENIHDGKSSDKTILSFKKTLLSMYKMDELISRESVTEENALQEIACEIKELKIQVAEIQPFFEYFVGLCYNFSLKCKKANKYDIALNTLLLAYDFYKSDATLSKSMKQNIYLLVHVCLEYDENTNWQYASDALELLKRHEIDMFYIRNKLKISKISGQLRYLEVLDEALEWENIKPVDVNEIVNFLLKNNFTTHALKFIWKTRHKPVPLEEKFKLMEVELEIYLSQNDDRALSLIENMLDAAKGVPASCAESLYRSLASYAAKKFQERQLKDSLIWYKFCAQLCESSSLDESLHHQTKLRICLCYLEMNEHELASEYLFRLKKTFFPGDSLYIYIALQVAFLCNNQVLFSETLSTQAGCCEKFEAILASCCRKAFLSGNRSFAIKCLETLIHQHNHEGGTLLAASVSRCLICLSVPKLDEWNQEISEKCLLHLDKALNALQENPDHPETSQLSEWFSRATWNLALAPNIDPKSRFHFFLRCCCFSELASNNLTYVKNSLMLAAAAGLQVVRNQETDSERDDILRKVMTLLDKCKRLETGSNIPLLRLLYVCEFEARCLAEPRSDGLESLQEILRLPFVDVEILQHIATIANAYKAKYKVVIEVLKLAAAKVPENSQMSSDASRIYHSLIEVMFYTQEYHSPTAEDENFQICSKLLNHIENMLSDYPQLEILWLMTKCWNWGIQKLTLNENKQAYKWCTLAMAFLNKLGSLKVLHERRLKDMYATYFSEKGVKNI